MTPNTDIDRTTRLDLPTTLDPDMVHRFLRTARAIARRNRNKGGHHAIMLISTDAKTVNLASPWNRKLVERKNLDGEYRPNAGKPVIYIRPDQTRRELIFTLVHEVAHHYTTSGGYHNRAFRRLYAMLLAAAARIFNISGHSINVEIRNCILRYVKPHKDNTRNSTYWTSPLSAQDLFEQACLESAADCYTVHTKAARWLAEPAMRPLWERA